MDKLKKQLSNQLTENVSEDKAATDDPNLDSLATVFNAIVTMSDMRLRTIQFWYGAFAKRFSLSGVNGETKPSIWEEEILSKIQPDDLKRYFFDGLLFLNFIYSKPPHKRQYFHMEDTMKMLNNEQKYMPVHFYLYYILSKRSKVIKAITIYTPLTGQLMNAPVSVDDSTGISTILSGDSNSLLSNREKEVLKLIEYGLSSKMIAEHLHVSTNTVNRHRQNIIQHLNVHNTTEAVSIAKSYGLI